LRHTRLDCGTGQSAGRITPADTKRRGACCPAGSGTSRDAARLRAKVFAARWARVAPSWFHHLKALLPSNPNQVERSPPLHRRASAGANIVYFGCPGILCGIRRVARIPKDVEEKSQPSVARPGRGRLEDLNQTQNRQRPSTRPSRLPVGGRSGGMGDEHVLLRPGHYPADARIRDRLAPRKEPARCSLA